MPITANQKVSRNLELMDLCVIGMFTWVEAIGEKLDDTVASVLSRREADVMYDSKRDRLQWAVILIRGKNEFRLTVETCFINHFDSFPVRVWRACISKYGS